MNQATNVTNRAVMALAIGFSALALPPVVEAQPRWGRPAAPRSGACFYRDAGFSGDYFCAQAGQEVPFLPRGMNNQISSIRSFGDAEVRIYQRNRFVGRAASVDGDVWNLRQEGWNDRVSSIRVRYDRNDRNARNDRGDSFWLSGISITLGNRGRDGRSGGYGRGNDGRGYDGRSYDGRDSDRRRNDGRDNDRRRNDGRADDGRGNDGRGYDVRGSNDGRGQLTEQQAEQLVAAAYRAVLSREPDPASKGWVDRVLRERLTQAQLEAELRKSPEYQNKRR